MAKGHLGKSGERHLRRWAFLAAVNIGAVVVAVLAFGIWKRSQPVESPSSATRVEGSITAGFYEQADDVGYITRAGASVTARELIGERAIYDVAYTTGADNFRVVPKADEHPDACVLLFGDSFTFGIGVKDEETFAAKIVSKSKGLVAVRNFGVGGWGPQQFLAGLQSGRFQRAVTCKPTDAVYLMIPDHLYRTIGKSNAWDKNAPRYQLDAGGRLVRKGRLGDPDDFSWRQLIGLDRLSDSEVMELSVAIFVEGASHLRQSYPGIRFHFISWHHTGPMGGDLMPDFEWRLSRVGIMPLPVEAIIPLYRYRTDDYSLDPLDTHPNPHAHRLIADFILRLIHESSR
jgi:hypothetical protein